MDQPQLSRLPVAEPRPEPTWSIHHGNMQSPHDDSIRRSGRLLITNGGRGDKKAHGTTEEIRYLSPSPTSTSPISHSPAGSATCNSWQERLFLTPDRVSPLRRFWSRNKPAIFVALAQLFAALMNLSARLLELEGGGMHPVQVLLLRQLLTSTCCFGYMWWNKVPGFPFGGSDVRWLLVIRGITGFMGILGMWYSMVYLPLADATVITFLAPGVAGLGCYLLLREPFTRTEQLATLVALFGVILIAQPTAFFASSDSAPDESSGSSLPDAEHQTTSKERLIAVGVGMLGVIGSAGAFTSLRAIGKRAHPVVSVNIFAVICTVICSGALVVAPTLDLDQPALRWVTPSSAKQWLLIIALSALGFIMQYLLTHGLGADKSNRANAMVYSHMVFAVAFDRWVFGHTMGLTSLLGCSLILGSAVSVVFAKRPVTVQQSLKADDCERQSALAGDNEGTPMLVAVGGNTTIVDRDGSR